MTRVQRFGLAFSPLTSLRNPRRISEILGESQGFSKLLAIEIPDFRSSPPATTGQNREAGVRPERSGVGTLHAPGPGLLSAVTSHRPSNAAAVPLPPLQRGPHLSEPTTSKTSRIPRSAFFILDHHRNQHVSHSQCTSQLPWLRFFLGNV